MAEAAAEATEKAYCDEEMAKTEAKKSELEDDVAKLTSKIDTNVAKSAELKEEVKELQAALAELAKQQAEMDKMQKEEEKEEYSYRCEDRRCVVERHAVDVRGGWFSKKG